MTVEQDNKHRSNALEATRKMIKHLKAAYPYRTNDSIKGTCDQYILHVLNESEE